MSSIIHIDAYIATGIQVSIYIYNRAQPLSVSPISPEFLSVAGHFFHSRRLMIANVGKRACEPFRGNSARKELRSACMTPIYDSYKSRPAVRNGGERRLYTRAGGGPLYLACNGVRGYRDVSYMPSKGGLKRTSWIFIRGYCKINAGTGEIHGKRAAKKNEQSHNPGGYVYVFPELFLFTRILRLCARARARISTDGLKFHPILPRRDRRYVKSRAFSPESSDIYFRSPETPLPLPDCSTENPVAFDSVWKIWSQW